LVSYVFVIHHFGNPNLNCSAQPLRSLRLRGDPASLTFTAETLKMQRLRRDTSLT